MPGPFFENQAFALYGMSRNRSKFGNTLYRHLSTHGYTVYPIHPEAPELNGVQTYSSIAELPQPVQAAVVNLPPARTAELIPRLAADGIKQLFLQQGSHSDAVLALCREHGLRTWYGSCAILNSKPTGFHAIHGFFARLFGGWAREL